MLIPLTIILMKRVELSPSGIVAQCDKSVGRTSVYHIEPLPLTEDVSTYQ